jgi:hypothetical protein
MSHDVTFALVHFFCLPSFGIFMGVHMGGHAVAQLVEALCYKAEGRGFDYRCCHWNFLLT